MREIHGVEEAVAVLAPHWEAVETWFNQQNDRFLSLMDSDHDVLGRVLKAHLAVEKFLTQFLNSRLGVEELASARLRFYQKACLLPATGSSASFVKPGILTLNAIRNRLGHEPDAALSIHDLGSVSEVLDVARPTADFSDPVDRLEAFAAVACTLLLVAPDHLQGPFREAFAHVHALPESKPD